MRDGGLIMEEKIVSIYSIGPRDVFHFANSLRPFILRGDRFININGDEVILWEDLENTDLMFYNNENVAVFGELSY